MMKVSSLFFFNVLYKYEFIGQACASWKKIVDSEFEFESSALLLIFGRDAVTKLHQSIADDFTEIVKSGNNNATLLLKKAK